MVFRHGSDDAATTSRDASASRPDAAPFDGPRTDSAVARDAGSPKEAASSSDAGAPDPCDPPDDTSKTALCLELSAEAIQPEPDGRFDGRGILYVELYDRPVLTGDAVLLASYEYTGADGGELSIAALPSVRIEEDLPTIVFSRILFADNPASVARELTSGAWLDSSSLELGVGDALPLRRLELGRGRGRTVTAVLTPVRKLDVDVSATTEPLGDGEGPLRVWVLSGPAPTASTRLLGHGIVDCVSLAPAAPPVTVSVPFAGSGPMWVAAVLDDFSLSSSPLSPGSLTNATLGDGGSPVLPDRIDVAEDSYFASTSIALDRVVPLGVDAGAGAPSCADLGELPDAGPPPDASSPADAAFDSGPSAPDGSP